MDRQVTIRFYTVEKQRPQVPDLREVFEEIFARNLPDREAQLAVGIRARLERFEVQGGEFTGEFTRVQNTNYPSEVHPDGTKPLSVKTPLGHGVAFRYRQRDHTLAVQYDARTMSPGRMLEYLKTLIGDADFVIRPKMDTSNWRRMEQHPLKKLTVAVASPNHLGEIEDSGAAVGQSLQRLGQAYEAPLVTIEIGMGGRKGSLPAAAKQMARQIFGLYAEDQADLRKLKAMSQTGEGERSEEINLLDEVLSKRDELELPDNDPETSYRVRRDYLRAQLQAHG